MHVSSEYITSWVLRSLTSTAGQTLCVLLADIIPWILKLGLCHVAIACMLCAMPWCSEAVRCCQVCLLWLKFVIIEVESRSETHWGAGIDVACSCVHTTLMTFYHIMHHYNYAATRDVVQFLVPYPRERRPTMECRPTPHFGLNFLLRSSVYTSMRPCVAALENAAQMAGLWGLNFE